MPGFGLLSGLTIGLVILRIKELGADNKRLLLVGLGDALMVGSACLWSLQTVRLGRHAKKGYEQLSLARTQTGVFALLSMGWLAEIWATAQPGHSPTGNDFETQGEGGGVLLGRSWSDM